jgi:hypothetical protein
MYMKEPKDLGNNKYLIRSSPQQSYYNGSLMNLLEHGALFIKIKVVQFLPMYSTVLTCCIDRTAHLLELTSPTPCYSYSMQEVLCCVSAEFYMVRSLKI